MKIVKYEKNLRWVGTMKCRKCHKETLAWRSSGMSMCFPHFYCDKCSNVIHRIKDQELVWYGATEEKLKIIEKDLPDCSCGGRFRPGANPKCGYCGHEFHHQNDIIKRLSDPHMIVTNGSCIYSDSREPYQIIIE